MARRQTTTIRSLDELGSVLGEYAQAVLERERLENALERRIAQLREECRARVEALAAAEEALLNDMAAYAVLNPEIFPDGRKSLELAHGTVGMRTGTPRVTLKKGLKEEDVVARLDEDGIASLVRERRELDRAAAIRDWAEGDRRRAVLGFRADCRAFDAEALFGAPGGAEKYAEEIARDVFGRGIARLDAAEITKVRFSLRSRASARRRRLGCAEIAQERAGRAGASRT